jgi:hypothetical protein
MPDQEQNICKRKNYITERSTSIKETTSPNAALQAPRVSPSVEWDRRMYVHQTEISESKPDHELASSQAHDNDECDVGSKS